MPKRIEANVGDRFGRLVIIKEIAKRDKQRYFLCSCDCGDLREVRYKSLRAGEQKSCGCARNERNRTSNLIHGQWGNPLYWSWHSMKQRCLNPKTKTFRYYGGRGITICKEWLDYEVFHIWAMRAGYKEGLTIERKDCNGNYEPLNCTWIPQSEQGNNTRRSVKVTFQSKTQILKKWSIELGIPYHLLCSRLHRGWPPERAFTEPLQEKFSNRVTA